MFASDTATELLPKAGAMALVVFVKENEHGQLEMNYGADIRTDIDPVLRAQLYLVADVIGKDIERRLAEIVA